MKRYPVLTTATIIVISALFGITANSYGDDAEPSEEASTVVLETEIARISYAVGMQLGESLKRSEMEFDTTMLFAAIEDILKGKKPALNEQEVIGVMTALQEKMAQEMQSKSVKNLEGATEFLAKNAQEEGVIQLESGLQYKVVRAGDGEKPVATSKVRVHYRGTLLDGEEFDSSYGRGEPTEFQVNQVISGWQEALQLMPVGSEYKLFIPPDLGYGDQGNPRIPGNSVLIFDVELLDIVE